MEVVVQLFCDFLKKYASDSNGLVRTENLDGIKNIFVKLYEKNAHSKVQQQDVDVVKNSFGNLEHKATRLVFIDHSTHGMVAIGKQVDDKLLKLTINDVLICYNMKWKYSISHCIGSAQQSQECDYAVEI